MKSIQKRTLAGACGLDVKLYFKIKEAVSTI